MSEERELIKSIFPNAHNLSNGTDKSLLIIPLNEDSSVIASLSLYEDGSFGSMWIRDAIELKSGTGKIHTRYMSSCNISGIMQLICVIKEEIKKYSYSHPTKENT